MKRKGSTQTIRRSVALSRELVQEVETFAPSDLKGLRTFMAAHEVNRGILVTKNTFKKITEGEKEIFMIPAWMFLLVQRAP